MNLGFVWFFFVTVGLLVLATPLFVISFRRDRPRTSRNFALAAVVIGVACGSLAGISQRQVQQCQDAGIADCVDSGTAGLQLLFIGLFVVVTWFTAYTMYRD